MSFNTECISALWNETSSKWEITIHNVQTREPKVVYADAFVYAVGRLNNYKIPKISGQDIFQGKQIHTANWPAGLDVRGQRVVVIGNGASAVQCTAALQPGKQGRHVPYARLSQI